MKSILDRDHLINQSYLLEASAGTGKTYTIENIFARLIVEEMATIDQILVVTFTRVATAELKQRIRRNLSKTLQTIKNGTSSQTTPDYLQALLEKEHNMIEEARRRIELALFCFDQAQIFTIHGFCSRMLREHSLECDQTIELKNEEVAFPPKLVYKVIRDYFRTEMRETEFTKNELQLVLKHFKYKQENLEKALYQAVTNGSEIMAPPILQESTDPLSIFARMALGCQQLFQKVTQEEEFPIPDELLKTMLKAVQNPIFVQAVQEKYRAAVIDEFQDTDPIQWEIFKHLFSQSQHCHLYLVGDPKQSIYAFRQADIYTYLSAASTIPKDNQLSLDTNYRSQAPLIEGLNALFTTANHPDLITLPRLNHSLTYHPIKAGSTATKEFKDQKGSIHFGIVEAEQKKNGKRWPTDDIEESYFFPFITQEIQNLHHNDNWRYDQCAILVKDRHQAKRIAEYLKNSGIPSQTQHGVNLADSPSLNLLKECLEAVLNPRDHSSMKVALGNRLIGWNYRQIQDLADQEKLVSTLKKFYDLQKIVKKEGFGSFYTHLLKSHWHNDSLSVAERLLMQQEGLERYRELEQIAALIMDQQLPSEELINFLDSFEEMKSNEDERLKAKGKQQHNSVQILTMHMSKGLEFDAVFALGLCNRPSQKEELIPIFANGKRMLAAPTDTPEEICQLSREEIDAEKMRQLYVALTRAKYRLYLPVAIEKYSSEMSVGSASPMELFLARWENSNESIYQKITKLSKEQLIHQLERLKAPITYSLLEKMAQPVQMEQQNGTVELVRHEAQFVIPGKERFVQSFTSLTKEIEEVVPRGILGREENCLPCGPEIGILFHTIFEKISFSEFKSMDHFSQCLPLIKPWMEESFAENWGLEIAKIVFQTLKTPLPTGFSLSEINMAKSYREMEFLYSGQDNNLLKGFVDLIFEHQSLYYIVDWKSNWLGPTSDCYSEPMLEEAMRQNHYLLQIEIYKEALRKYLNLVEKRPFEECFGGVFYLFIRGISSQQQGIFYRK